MNKACFADASGLIVAVFQTCALPAEPLVPCRQFFLSGEQVGG
jgi:hypothetical protein